MRRSRQGAATAGILAGVLGLAGCAPAPTAISSASPSLAPSVGASSIASPSASASPSADAAPASAAGAVAVDPSLLDVLPDEVEGHAIRSDDVTAAEIASNDDLAPDVEAIALALYIQPGSSTADDLAIVNVVRVRPGVFDEAWFRSWRGTYDVGACEIAGGIKPGSAVSQIGTHETHIGSCVGGVHTYHVHLPNPDRVVSITAAGEGRFGARVVAGLRE